jgi:pimeloyl-ACP methyl ester carboxylesterase
MDATKDHDKFVGKWLHSLEKQGPSKPVIAIQNGWQAEYHQNQWYADELRNDLTIYAYDTRGNGQSPKSGDLHATQLAIDANSIIGKAFDKLDNITSHNKIEPGNKILQGNCIGTMPIAALFAAKLPLSKRVDGTVLISPVSSLSLPPILKMGYFFPVWMLRFAIRYLAEPIANKVTPGEDSEFTRKEAIKRAKKIIPEVALKQAKQVFWKQNVSNYWKHIRVPSLLLVSKNDPIVKLEDSIDPFNRLPYPIWYELKAPDHMLLEGNIELLKEVIPKFVNNPWDFYEEHKHLKPNSYE